MDVESCTAVVWFDKQTGKWLWRVLKNGNVVEGWQVIQRALLSTRCRGCSGLRNEGWHSARGNQYNVCTKVIGRE